MQIFDDKYTFKKVTKYPNGETEISFITGYKRKGGGLV